MGGNHLRTARPIFGQADQFRDQLRGQSNAWGGRYPSGKIVDPPAGAWCRIGFRERERERLAKSCNTRYGGEETRVDCRDAQVVSPLLVVVMQVNFLYVRLSNFNSHWKLQGIP